MNEITSLVNAINKAANEQDLMLCYLSITQNFVTVELSGHFGESVILTLSPEDDADKEVQSAARAIDIQEGALMEG